jgi:poly(3-hydroxyalkanoate) depolymerase
MLEPFGRLRQAQFAYHTFLGHRIRAARWPADAKGLARPLLFFTGIGANIELLAPFLETLRGRDVITFDMPGIGGSEEWRRPYRLSTMADVASQLIRRLGYDAIDIMGVSWGGMLAQEFAYRNPRSVKRLVLAATSPGIPMVPGSIATLVKMVTSHRYSDAGSIASYLQTLYGGSSCDLETYASRMQTPSSLGYLHQILAIVGWTSVRKLTQVRAKTLIIVGDDDRLVPPANGRILRFLLDDARFEVLKNAGHLFVLTHRTHVADMVEDFLGVEQRALSRFIAGGEQSPAVSI